MSMNVIDVVLAFVAAINRGSASDLSARMTEDHTFIDSRGAVTSGRESMTASWEEFYRKCPDYRIRVEEIYADGPRVAVFGSASGTYNGRRGPIPENHFEMPAAWRADVADGKIRLWQIYADWSEARRIIDEDERAAAGEAPDNA